MYYVMHFFIFVIHYVYSQRNLSNIKNMSEFGFSDVWIQQLCVNAFPAFAEV